MGETVAVELHDLRGPRSGYPWPTGVGTIVEGPGKGGGVIVAVEGPGTFEIVDELTAGEHPVVHVEPYQIVATVSTSHPAATRPPGR